MLNKPLTNQIATNRQPVTVDSDTGKAIATPKRKKHIKLDTIADVKNELARTYRATKAGDIAPEVGSRLTFMLGTIGKLIVDAELEARVTALEKGLNDET